MKNNTYLAKVAINKSLLKEYSNSQNDRIVYLNDGDEFQIQLFNPFSKIIGVSLSLNDKEEKSILVLKPGQRVWVERFLDNSQKLLFSTYEVGTSKEVQEAIKNNGKVVIKFYNEQEKNNWWNNTIYVNNNNNFDKYIPDSAKPIDVWYGNNTSITCDNNPNVNYSYTSYTMADGSVCSAASTYTASEAASLFNCELNKVETGRIEKGDISNQKFTNVNYDFEWFPFLTETILLYPMSRKQVNSNDLSRKYCHNCGRKLKDKFKFCPFCGAKQ